MGEQTRQQMHDMTQQAKDAAGNLVNQARTQVKTQLSSQKEKAAESLGSVAEAIRQTGSQLREQDQPMPVGQYADRAADMVDQVAAYLRNQEIDQMVGQVEDLARRQPAVFLGTAFAIGFMAARFLKSSSPTESSARHDYRNPRHSEFNASYYQDRESIREAELHERQGYPVKSVYERALERGVQQGASSTYGTMPEGYSSSTSAAGSMTDTAGADMAGITTGTSGLNTDTYNSDLDDDELTTDYSTSTYGTRSTDV
jgi:hypothetical protein